MVNYNLNMKGSLSRSLAAVVFLFLTATTQLGQSASPTDRPLYELQRNQTAYIDTPVEIYGNLELLNSYYGSFAKATKTHYAFMLREKVIRLETTAFVYMRRGGKGDEIYSKLSSMPEFAKLSGKFTVVISKKDASSHSYETVNAELTDFVLGAEKPQVPKPAPKNPATSVTTEYDRFRDETTITGIAHLIDCQDNANVPLHFDFGAVIKFSGKDAVSPTNITLTMRLIKYDIGSNPDFIFFVDGKRLVLGRGISEPKVWNFEGIRMSETVSSVKINFDAFKSIANANSVEAKVGDLEFAPPYVDAAAINRIIPVFRGMLDKIQPK